MIRRKMEERGSIRKENGMENLPTFINSNKETTWLFPLFISVNTMILKIKDMRIAPLPIIPETTFGRLFLKSPLMRNPASGIKGIKITSLFIMLVILNA
jgi:hypothetical protein